MSEFEATVIDSEAAIGVPAPVANGLVAKGATDLSAVKDVGLEKWLSSHHDNEKGVFLSVIQDKAGQSVNWAFGPFVLKITINFTGVTGEFGINIPFWGYKKLIDINGDLITGIGAGFDIGVASGSIKLYLKGKQVIFELQASAFGHGFKTSHVLLTL